MPSRVDSLTYRPAPAASPERLPLAISAPICLGVAGLLWLGLFKGARAVLRR